MRSFRYITGGTPQNLDDCLDRQRTFGTLGVLLRLRTDDDICGHYVVKRFVGRFTWFFSDRAVCVEEICGGCFIQDSGLQQASAVDGANRRLLSILGKLSRLPVHIRGAPRFEYSPAYR